MQLPSTVRGAQDH